MIRGTTPTHTFKTSMDLTGAVVLFLTYKQQYRKVVEKTIDDVSVTPEAVVVRLSQADTLAFKETVPVEMQIRARFPDGTAVACKPITASVGEILKEGVI